VKALFILPTLDRSVGRHFTHIRLWRKNGGKTTVAAFARGNVTVWDNKVDIVLGQLKSNNILSRLPAYKRAIDDLIRVVREHDVVFVYTLDNFVFVWMSKIAARSDIKIILFITDIRPKFIGDSLFNQITQSFLKFSFEQSELVLVTSRYYIEEFATKYLGSHPDQWFEIENRVDSEIVDFDAGFSVSRDHPYQIVIGYFGLIRCARSVEILLSAVNQSRGNVKVIMRGILSVPPELQEEIADNPWILYRGPFNNPADLGEIYGSVDIVWTCYPYSTATEGNHMWAKTNRFYEAGYFKKPMIASLNTKDGDYVATEGIGLVVDLSEVERTVAQVNELVRSKIEFWRESLVKIPDKEFVYSYEFSRLYHTLMG